MCQYYQIFKKSVYSFYSFDLFLTFDLTFRFKYFLVILRFIATKKNVLLKMSKCIFSILHQNQTDWMFLVDSNDQVIQNENEYTRLFTFSGSAHNSFCPYQFLIQKIHLFDYFNTRELSSDDQNPAVYEMQLDLLRHFPCPEVFLCINDKLVIACILLAICKSLPISHILLLFHLPEGSY